MTFMKTIVIKANRGNKNKILGIAVSTLKNNGIIIYPTETLYGIGADATNEGLIKKIFDIKQRPFDKKFISAVSDIGMAKKYFKVNKEIKMLAKKFMPGPLTLISEDKNGNERSFRMPKDRLMLKIIKEFGRPITSTSANISDMGPNNIDEIIGQFSGKVDLIIDAGNRNGRPSTVFNIRTKKIVREGPITRNQIMNALKNNEHRVLCGGCFNKIHSGHIYFLKKAKSFGRLIVVLTNDRNNKKPYAIPAKERKINLKKLKIADKIVIGDAKDYAKAVKKYRPQIIALGYDQKLKKKTKDIVKKMNIRVKRIEKYGDYSTSSM